ncbi:MAG: A/G-specific adenine glycosylase [Actinomycetota bacterium]|nr:A/G-specific adenine glycosylase [Actinomycetota bacterium]
MQWYAGAARELPWRQPGVDPWAVLVSEVMLQQTPVHRVVPAYTAWLQRWPTPAALAAEPAGEAVRMWGRLGYPRRALRLHECAVAIVQHHSGHVPAEIEKLLGLPGVGPYTARAVATFAHGRRHAVVDVNVRRVANRLVRGADDQPPPSGDQALVGPLVPADPAQAVRFAAAMMELGALVCTARTPLCRQCPVAACCAWRRAGYPAGPARPSQPYSGTDRQARGRLLAVLRATPDPVRGADLDAAWPDPRQRARALASLQSDRLVERLPGGEFALPGYRISNMKQP